MSWRGDPVFDFNSMWNRKYFLIFPMGQTTGPRIVILLASAILSIIFFSLMEAFSAFFISLDLIIILASLVKGG